VSLAGPIATIIAAGVAVFVTWRLGKGQLHIAEQQATTARQQAELAGVRLQHDLFDRRFAVYEAAQKMAFEVLKTSNVSREGLRAFVRDTEKSVFLLDKDLSDYLTDMRDRAVKLQIAVGKLANETLPEGSEWSELPKERADLSTWFVDQFDVLVEKFKPTLTLGKLQLASAFPRGRVILSQPPRSLKGEIRLWIVISAIWSIGWSLWIAWREIVDQVGPIRTDFFVVPLIILAPWLITASVLAAKWVAAGFKP
jgi:hypothetical protein